MVWGPGQYKLAPSSQASYGDLQGAIALSTEFTAANPILPLGYLAFETDTTKIKIGNGVSDWNTLPYWYPPIPYGSVWGNEIAWSQASMVQNTWYAVSHSDLADGLFLETAHDGSGKITVQTAGVYHLVFAASVEVNANNKHVQMGLMVNGAALDDGIVHQETNVANQQFSLASAAIVRLAVGDYVQLAFRTTDAGTPTIQGDHANITMMFLGV